MSLQAPKCATCTKNYGKDPPMVPLILNCGHTYCEGCITKWGRLIKNSGNINCPDCSECHYIENQKSIKQLQINSHIYGIITAPNRSTENAIDNIVQDLTNKLNDIAMTQCSEDTEEEEECSDEFPPCCECKDTAEVICDACDLPYCKECCNECHKLVALRNHTQRPCETQPLFEECSHHPNAAQPTHFLELTGQPVCTECHVVGKTVPILCESDQIEDLIHQHNLTSERLVESDQDVADVIPVVEDDFARMRQELRKEYAYFHGLLQARERAQMGDLEIEKTKIIQPLLDARCDIARANKATRSNFNWILKNKNNKKILIKKQQKVQEIKEAIDSTKCTLYVTSEKRPTITTKKNMLSQCITEFCKLNTLNVHEYALDTIQSDIGRKYRVDEEVFASPEKKERDKSEWEIPILLSTQPAEPLTVKLANPDDRDKVIVSEVYSPHHFFVQRVKDRNDLDELQNILVKYYGLSATQEDHVQSVYPNELVCCQFTLDDLWYRACVVDVEEYLVKVLYIDYGNSEKVPVSRLRRMKPQFTHCSAMAIKCSLFGVTPRDGQAWTADAANTLKRLSADTEFEMITKGKNKDCTEVDLQQTGDGIGSIREFLVFTEHACFVQNSKTPTPPLPEHSEVEIDSVQVEPTPASWPQTTTGDGEEEDDFVSVFLTSGYDPSQFYATIVDEKIKVAYDDLRSDIDKHMETIGRNFPLKQLKKGTMCLALFPPDSSFYRATIVGSKDFSVEVFYCDYGNSDLVERSDLYEITRDLVKLPAQAILCKLHGVKPPDNEEKWSERSIRVFDELALNRMLFALSKGVEEDGVRRVILVDTTRGDDDIHIKSEMIAQRAALSDIEEAEVGTNDGVSDDINLGPVNSTHTVSICHVASPHLINVNLEKYPYPPFFTKLNNTYASFIKTGNHIIERNTTWNIGDYCVAFIKDMGLFVRAQITSFTLPQSAMVENVDQGRVLKVFINDLKVLIEDFSLKMKPKFAVSCRIFDVAPPTGSAWTADQYKMVMKYFSKRVKKRKAACTITVKKEKDPGSSVWEVDMYIRDLTTGVVERVSDGLIKNKLAKPANDNMIQCPVGCYKDVNLQGPGIQGKVVNVSNNCTLYFTPDSLQLEKDVLSNSLSEFSELPSIEDVAWKVGAPCVVKSGSWFNRGLVIRIISSKLLMVFLVDTGTEQQFHVKFAYTTFLCPEIPMMATPLTLADIQPAWHTSDGSWTNPAKIYLYEKVVNEKCKIDVMGKQDGCYQVALHLLTGENVSESMVSKGFAASCSSMVQSPSNMILHPTQAMSIPQCPLGVQSPAIFSQTSHSAPPNIAHQLPSIAHQLPSMVHQQPSLHQSESSQSSETSYVSPDVSFVPKTDFSNLPNAPFLNGILVPQIVSTIPTLPATTLPPPRTHSTVADVSPPVRGDVTVGNDVTTSSGGDKSRTETTTVDIQVSDETRDLIDGC